MQLNDILVIAADLSDAAAPFWYPVLNSCALVGVCGWLMWKVENRLESIGKTNTFVGRAIERQTQAQMVMMLGIKSLDDTAIKTLANRILSESREAVPTKDSDANPNS